MTEHTFDDGSYWYSGYCSFMTLDEAKKNTPGKIGRSYNDDCVASKVPNSAESRLEQYCAMDDCNLRFTCPQEVTGGSASGFLKILGWSCFVMGTLIGICFAIPKIKEWLEKMEKDRREGKRPDHDGRVKKWQEDERARIEEEERLAAIEAKKKKEAHDTDLEAKSTMLGGKIHSTQIGNMRMKIDEKMKQNEKKRADAEAAKQAERDRQAALAARSDAQKWMDGD
jgi:hypothetical protein